MVRIVKDISQYSLNVREGKLGLAVVILRKGSV